MGDVLVRSQSRQQKTNEIKVISLHLRARTAGNCQYNNGLISLNIIKHIIIVYLPESVDL